MALDERDPGDPEGAANGRTDQPSGDVRHDDLEREGERRWMAHELEDRASTPPPTRAPAAPSTPARPRPLIERVGMAAIAFAIAMLFGGVALAAFGGGEPFLGVMAAIGALLTVWVGAQTLVRG
jgi:hypothetical protein